MIRNVKTVPAPPIRKIVLVLICLCQSFARHYHGTVWQLFKQSLLFIRQEKKWWLIPLIFMLLLLGALILFSSTSVLAPFMYPFM